MWFNVRAIICDSHPSNVVIFKKLLEYTNQNPTGLYMWYETRKKYVCYDVVHLTKDIRNNLLNHK